MNNSGFEYLIDMLKVSTTTRALDNGFPDELLLGLTKQIG